MFYEHRWSNRSVFLLISCAVLFILPAYIFAWLLTAFLSLGLNFVILMAIGLLASILLASFTGYRRMQIIFILAWLLGWYLKTH